MVPDLAEKHAPLRPSPERVAARVVPAGPAISIVVPTRHEADGVAALLDRIDASVSLPTEVIFVDDSDDMTAFRVRTLGEAHRYEHLEIRLAHRPFAARRGGLGSAVVEGLRRARGEWACVIDADLQHPPELIEQLVAAGRSRRADIVVASRYLDGGSDSALPGWRRAMSRGCALYARALLPRRLGRTTDPLSGFFAVRTAAIDVDVLHPQGFKILLEVLGRHPRLRVVDVGYVFQERYAGLSKASARELVRFGRQIVALKSPGADRAPAPHRQIALYDIHGILTIRSAHRLPELEKFRVRQLTSPPDIEVGILGRADTALVELEQTVPHIRYGERLGHHGFVAEVELLDTDRACAWVSPLVARSEHVLYTNVVEPMIRWALVKRGHVLVHAACFARDGEAFLITARTDTGKTTTMLKLLDRGGLRFVSDDLTLLDATGRVLTYPKPLTISNHTVHALTSAELDRVERTFLPLQSRVHSRAGRRFAFLIASQRFPVATLNAVVQLLIPPPKYHVERLVPGVESEHDARLRALFVIERSTDTDDVRMLDADETVDTFLANGADAYGFPPYEKLEPLLRFPDGDETDLATAEAEIIRSALGALPSYGIRSSNMGWAEAIAQLIDEGALAHAVVPDELGRPA